MQINDVETQIDAIRSFNRFFTRQIGVLREGLLHSPYSLTEVRILFEIAHSNGLTASDLSRELGLDPSYLSRILGRLEQKGLIDKVRSETDGRQRLLSLTSEGKEVFNLLDDRSREEVAEMLSQLSEGDRQRLLEAMHTIENVLSKGEGFKFSEPFILRQPEPGDMGWIVHRHGVLYAQEYGWDERFEALVAQIAADFINNHNPARERGWIAEMNGEIVGSVFVTKDSDTVAKLRLLLVEPKARGLGLGNRLVKEAIRFAQRSGYRKMMLWTNSVLKAARHIYEKHGFKLVKEEEHHSFGHDLVGEYWELTL
ncbi:bifunctional helix-turn-helix transcriptional regulator/GNAT family N-acetyltransferase [Alicyclobacillus shizuokensis]|uniref:bifunctional helix-turn-helix transcriptional regulator/GNAT family N-acetyltransferase n=1 Tax=Alicyclobacillus shizuokensis TaxID=392014 RepID=UPI00083117E5|nr:bifunctional helix-turn-helix transcriptional regulator/GNAT family N-acetyltransferase [Alicyclobacillus shizuokensis]